MKHTSRLLIALVMLLALASGSVMALASGIELPDVELTTLVEGDFTFRILGDHLTLSQYNGNAAQVEIPASVQGKAVTRIGSKAFCGNQTLQSVTIPSSVTEIEGGNGEDTVYGAFAQCPALVAVNIAEGSQLTVIGSYAFYECGQLSWIILPSSLRTIGVSAFEFCTSLTELVLPQGLETVDTWALSDTNLTELTIPASCTHFGEGMLLYSLTAYHVSDGNPNYFAVDGVLYQNTDGVAAFMEYPAAKTATTFLVPDQVDLVDGYRLAARLPVCVEQVVFGHQEIYSVTALPCDIQVASTNPYYTYENGMLMSKDKELLLYISRSLTGTVTVPQGVISVEEAAGANCRFQAIVFPESLQQVAPSVFQGAQVQEITFQGDLPAIAYAAFQDIQATAYYPLGNATWNEEALQNYGGQLTWVGKSPVAVPAKPYKIANTVSGVHVYWKAVEGAAKYGLWRSETGKNGTYKWIANPTVEHFTDTKVESGKTYFYKVTAMDPNGKHTDKSEALGTAYVDTPDISLRVNRAAGIGLGWDKIDGATGYAIYRKSYSGSDAWVRVATVQGGDTLSWNDTSVKNNNGTVYRYTIRALYGTTLSGCRNTGRTMTRLTSRTLSGATAPAKGSTKVTWGTTSQATGYEIRFMVGSKVYKTFTIGNYKTGVKTFTNLPAGTYKIQVRAYKNVAGVGSFYSAWSTAKNLTVK